MDRRFATLVAAFGLSLGLLAGCRSPGDKSATTAEKTTTAKAGAAAPAGVCADEPVKAAANSCDDGCQGQACGNSACENSCCNAGAAAAGESLVPAAHAKVGDRTRCPVSGGVFVVRPDTVRVDYDGQSYPVCCPGCAARLRANPEKYLDS
jgi:hypothetical protein